MAKGASHHADPSRRPPRMVSAFINSINGLQWALREEKALRDEVVGLIVAVPAAALIAPDPLAFAAMIGVILLVIAVELLNTAVETLADHLAPYRHPAIGLAKDLGSGAVFVCLLLAGLVWFAVLVTRLGA
jgi:diacylglycerol kinase (ATP)